MADGNDSRNNSLKIQMPRSAEADDIQHQIDDQIRMREGAMKLMSACSTLNQALETSKNLLTINARILGLMSALQKKKKQHVLKEYNRQRISTCMDSAIDACTGRVAISDIRVPLMWKDNVHFTGKTGDQSYYAFALIRCGDQVRDTLLYEVTSADTDMYFEQPLIFEELTPDFKMDFEIYYTVITGHEAHVIRASMPLRTNKKTLHFNAPKFCLAGHVQLTIDDVQTGMISRDLVMGGQGASGVAVLGDITEFPVHPLELWGQICCTLVAQPRCMLEDGIGGTCQVKVDNNWEKYYLRVYPSAVSCWLSEQYRTTKPIYVMSFTDVTKVSEMENTKEIHLISSSGNVLHSLLFDDSVECLRWLFALRCAIVNFQSWKLAVTEFMHIEEAKKHRLSIPTQASFYDQIGMDSFTNGVSKRNGNHLTPALDSIQENAEQIGMQILHSKISNEFSDTSTQSPEKEDYQNNMKERNQLNEIDNAENRSLYVKSQAVESDHLQDSQNLSSQVVNDVKSQAVESDHLQDSQNLSSQVVNDVKNQAVESDHLQDSQNLSSQVVNDQTSDKEILVIATMLKSQESTAEKMQVEVNDSLYKLDGAISNELYENLEKTEKPLLETQGNENVSGSFEITNLEVTSANSDNASTKNIVQEVIKSNETIDVTLQKENFKETDGHVVVPVQGPNRNIENEHIVMSGGENSAKNGNESEREMSTPPTEKTVDSIVISKEIKTADEIAEAENKNVEVRKTCGESSFDKSSEKEIQHNLPEIDNYTFNNTSSIEGSIGDAQSNDLECLSGEGSIQAESLVGVTNKNAVNENDSKEVKETDQVIANIEAYKKASSEENKPESTITSEAESTTTENLKTIAEPQRNKDDQSKVKQQDSFVIPEDEKLFDGNKTVSDTGDQTDSNKEQIKTIQEDQVKQCITEENKPDEHARSLEGKSDEQKENTPDEHVPSLNMPAQR